MLFVAIFAARALARRPHPPALARGGPGRGARGACRAWPAPSSSTSPSRSSCPRSSRSPCSAALLVVAPGSARRGLVAGGRGEHRGVTALIGAALVATYPHMAFLEPDRDAPGGDRLRAAQRHGGRASCASCRGGDRRARRWRSRSPRTSSRRASAGRRPSVRSSPAGRCPAFLPSHLVADIPYWGPSPRPAPSPGAWVASALIVALLLGCAAIRGVGRSARAVRDRRRGSSCSTSYALVYLREGGDTYRQWKWITFFLPLLVASRREPGHGRRHGPRPSREGPSGGGARGRRGRAGAPRGLPDLAGAHLGQPLARRATRRTSTSNPTWPRWPTEPRIRSLSGVNLNLADPIEARWLSAAPASTTWSTPIRRPRGSAADGRWSTPAAGTSQPGVEVIPINATYQLVREGPPVRGERRRRASGGTAPPTCLDDPPPRRSAASALAPSGSSTAPSAPSAACAAGSRRAGAPPIRTAIDTAASGGRGTRRRPGG